MRLLVLGGTRFLGRAVVDAALAAGWQVTTLTRGVSGAPPDGVDARTGDRTTDAGLTALAEGEWDVCVDTSGFVPRDVRRGARALAGRVGHYVFVSTLNVHPAWPDEPVSDASPVHDCPPDAGPDDGDYGVLKAGCERAVAESFPEAAAQVRSGVLIGPADNTHRLSWWLARIARGGDVLAPGRPDQTVQLVDVRDLAAWMLRCGQERVTGGFSATAPAGTQTLGELLDACVEVTGSGATLRWVGDDRLLTAGVEPWSELPLWLPAPVAATAWAVDVSAALASGLTIRPLVDSVVGTWEWIRRHPTPPTPNSRVATGLSPEKEQALLGTSC